MFEFIYEKDKPTAEMFKHNDYYCFVIRDPELQHWRGYVILKSECKYIKEKFMDISIHGGITFSGNIEEISGFEDMQNPIKKGFCLGFDCAHRGDLVPGYKFMSHSYSKMFESNSHYWTMEEVKEETKKLAEEVEKLEIKGVNYAH